MISGRRILELFVVLSKSVESVIHRWAAEKVPLQPCLRDIWHDHVLFEGDRVSGLIDFGSVQFDNVAANVARLLGSMLGDDAAAWQRGLAAFETVRPLSDVEKSLVSAFDKSTVLMAGLNWLQWFFREGRQFDDRGAVIARVDTILARMEAARARVSGCGTPVFSGKHD